MNTVSIRQFSIYRDENDGGMDRSSGLTQYCHESLEGMRKRHIRYRTSPLHGYFVHSVMFSSGEVYRSHGIPDPYQYENDWGDEDYDEGWGDDE